MLKLGGFARCRLAFFITQQAIKTRWVTQRNKKACSGLCLPGQSCSVLYNDGAGQLIVPNSKGYYYGRTVIKTEASSGNSASEEEHLVGLGRR